jgi:hypothetical protein
MHKSFNNRRIRKMQTRLGDSIVSIEVRLEEYSLFTPCPSGKPAISDVAKGTACGG